MKAGSSSVPITALLGLEDLVAKIIDDLHAKGMYPESEDESVQRMNAVEEHTARILAFLKDFVASQK